MAQSIEKEQSIQQLIEKSRNKKGKKITEKIMPILLLLAALISVVTTLGIVFTLIFETFEFFRRVSIVEFLFGTEWYPFSSGSPSFGVLPLILGTFKVTLIAIGVAVPIGLSVAIYLSEYASDKTRKIMKPILEVLAGVPTIVYGFFALTFVTPILQTLIPSLKLFNALSPGIVVGIMILPSITSLSEDAMNSVPNSIREGALALGATKLEVSIKSCIYLQRYPVLLHPLYWQFLGLSVKR